MPFFGFAFGSFMKVLRRGVEGRWEVQPGSPELIGAERGEVREC